MTKASYPIEQSPLVPLTKTDKVLVFLGIVTIYFILGYFGLGLATINRNVSPIWPASGFAIGALALFGRQFFPAVFIGSFLVNMSTETNLIGMTGVALGNMLEALVGHFLVTYALKKNYFKVYSEFFAIVCAAIVSSLVSSCIGIGTLYSIGVIPDKNLSTAIYTWWSGNAIGITLLLPLFLEILSSDEDRNRFSKRRLIYGSILLAVIASSIYFVFVRGLNQSFAWSLSPFLILSGMILGRIFSRILLIILAFLITALTASGFGPFEQGNTNANLIYVQTLLASYAFAVLFVKPLHTDYKINTKYIVGLMFGWITLFAVIFMTSSIEKHHTLDDLHKSTNSAIRALSRLEGRYEAMLKGTSALFQVSDNVTKDEWRTYVQSIELENYFDAIYGLGYVQFVEKKDVRKFEKENDIKIKYFAPEFTEQYDHYLIMKFIEPYDRNKAAIGYDMGSSPERRKTVLQSLDERQPIATEIMTLIQDPEKRKGFIVINPVFNKKNEYIGFVSAPVIAEIFFGRYLEQFSYNLRVRISYKDDIVFQMNDFPEKSIQQNVYYKKRNLLIFGLPLVVEFYPTETFFALHSGSSAALALLLNMFMLFIAAFLLEQLTFSQKAEKIVEDRTKELEISKIQLINSSKMASLGEMASGMAHEINNPLAIIQGKVQVVTMMLQDLHVKQPTVFEEINKIKTTTDRIDKIVKGLRNFSRASNNDPFEPISLRKLMDETLDLCFEKFKAHGIDLKIKNVPDVSILCRPSQISQVFINLLNNASDAIEELRQKWIEIDFKVEGNRVAIYITDSGTGIPPEIAQRIMEPFFTTKEVRKGTGLGLSIAKSIIETHHGVIWLDQKHTHTRFVIEFLIQT